MPSVLNAFQVGLYAALLACSPLAALVGARVYDRVPQNATFPYVAIGDDTAIDWSGQTHLGEEATITIHAWSRQSGRKEVKSIMNAIDDRLHRGSLALEGYGLVSLTRDFAETMEDPDGITIHGVQRFRARAQTRV